MNKTVESQRKEVVNVNENKATSAAFVVKNNEITTNNLLVSSRFPTFDDYSFVQFAENAYQSVLQYTAASNRRNNRINTGSLYPTNN